jgi:hypothetical protein
MLYCALVAAEREAVGRRLFNARVPYLPALVLHYALHHHATSMRKDANHLSEGDTPMTSQDEDAIRRSIAAFADTWNRHDMSAFAALFAEDGDCVNAGGTWWQARRD